MKDDQSQPNVSVGDLAQADGFVQLSHAVDNRGFCVLRIRACTIQSDEPAGFGSIHFSCLDISSNIQRRLDEIVLLRAGGMAVAIVDLLANTAFAQNTDGVT